MSMSTLTGKPSIDRPWLKYYPKALLDNLQVPTCTLSQYLQYNMPGLGVPAVHYYGVEITWAEIFYDADRVAKSLKVLGYGEGDQIPVFFRSVPEFIPMLLAAEKIGASLLLRDNTVEENADAIRKAGAHVIFAHDFLSQADMRVYMKTAGVKRVVLLSPCNSCDHDDLPEYVRASLESNYSMDTARGKSTMTWTEFLSLGDGYAEKVAAPVDIDRPLIRCYTSGSTGPSKQVIHSAHTMIGVLAQMNFYGAADVRPSWLLALLPPALVAVTISMILLPLASNKLLILDPWVDVKDIDLEFMRYRPNNMPMIPMFIELMMRNGRIPDDYDMSHLQAAGAGCEAYNNTQMRHAQRFLNDHNCNITFTTGYGSSEAGSNVAFHISGHPMGNGNAGCPMPLSVISIFKPGTDEELSYNMDGEICISGPGVMLGYDDPDATAKVLRRHSDGLLWLHMGDIGRMNEDGVLFTVGRGSSKRYGGGFLDILPMENAVADARIPGIDDQFFVNVPDPEHEGYYLPYLYVVLKDGYTIEDIRPMVEAALKPHMIPVEIHVLPERPFWHFKTNRIGLINEVMAARRARPQKRRNEPKKAVHPEKPVVQKAPVVKAPAPAAVQAPVPAAVQAPAPAAAPVKQSAGISAGAAIVAVLMALVLGVVLTVCAMISTGVTQIILFTAALCFLLQSVVILVVMVCLFSTKK